MKILTKDDLNSIERQLYNKGRDLDVAIFNTIMDPDCKEFVLDCLTMYVNSDGGFGNGLHIDNYDTHSSVYQTYEAFRILDEVGFDKSSENPLYHELVNKACNYLFNKCLIKDGAWNPNVATNEKFAHSEVFNYHEDFMADFGYHPTAAILGYVLNFLDSSKAYYKKAMRQLSFSVSYLTEKNNLNKNDYITFNSLLGSLKKANIAENECKIIEEKLLQEGKQSALEHQLDPLFLSNCTLDDTLTSLINERLDELIDRRASHGLWEHLEGWGSDRFPEADTAGLKWIGAETVNVLMILKRFGRLEK